MKKTKEKFSKMSKLILIIILFIILIILGVSIIWDVLNFTIKDKVNNTLFLLIYFILIFIFIEILFKTKTGKYIESKILEKK